MGALRLYITVVIVMGHLHTWYLMPVPLLEFLHSGDMQGIAKVHIYFLESGFLTQLQFLSLSFVPGTVRRYYRGRFLRIYPQYLLFTILTALAYFAFGDMKYLASMEKKGVGTAEMIFANSLALNLPTLRLWNMNTSMAGGYLLLPQAWTLTIQFGFILLAPFVLASRRRLIWATLLCTASMLYYYRFTWLLRNFFVTELAYFWFGAWIARLFIKLNGAVHRKYMVFLAAFFILPTMLLTIIYVPVEEHIGMWPMFAIYNILLGLSMIPAYYFSHGSALDRLFSRMAFTLFLSHYLSAFLIQQIVPALAQSGLSAMVVSLFFVLLVNTVWLRLWRAWKRRRVDTHVS